MNKILLSSILLSILSLASKADINETLPTTVDCTITQEVLYQPIGDDTGKEVLTSKKIFQHCQEIYDRQGPCIAWSQSTTTMSVPKAYGVGTEELDDTGNLGDALAMVSAINQTTAIFNGVKGYCEKGMSQDLSWLEDPIFWASIAMSTISAAGEPTSAMKEAAVEASATNAAKASAETALEEATTSLAQGVQDGLSSVEMDALHFAKDQASTTLGTATSEAASAAATNATELAKMTDIQKFADVVSNGYSGCAVTAGLDMLSAAVEYVSDEDECDPVDEFCSAEQEGVIDVNDPTMIRTLTTQEYDTMILENPQVVDSIEIIDDGATTGFVTLRFLSTGELIDYNALADNEAALQQAKQDAKDLQFEMKSIFAAGSMTACMGYNYFSKGTTQSGGGGIGGGESALLNAAVGMTPFPYNVIGSVALKLVDTWNPIDSCRDEEDANAAGSRHEKAYRGIKYNTCHPIKDPEVVERWPIGSVMRRGYSYCCFDSPMSKILMVQLKSQIGKGWTHCTDITLNELSHVSFKPCSASERDASTNGGYTDGATYRGVEGVDYDMKNSYQYKFQCMNLDELEDYIESQVPVDFSQTHVSEMLRDLTPQANE